MTTFSHRCLWIALIVALLTIPLVAAWPRLRSGRPDPSVKRVTERLQSRTPARGAGRALPLDIPSLL
jgi:hypothetical protein